MKIADVRANAFAMPLNNPAYPKPPYKFYNREFVVINYRTDIERLRAFVPEPLEVIGDTVRQICSCGARLRERETVYPPLPVGLAQPTGHLRSEA